MTGNEVRRSDRLWRLLVELNQQPGNHASERGRESALDIGRNRFAGEQIPCHRAGRVFAVDRDSGRSLVDRAMEVDRVPGVCRVDELGKLDEEWLARECGRQRL